MSEAEVIQELLNNAMRAVEFSEFQNKKLKAEIQELKSQVDAEKWRYVQQQALAIGLQTKLDKLEQAIVTGKKIGE